MIQRLASLITAFALAIQASGLAIAASPVPPPSLAEVRRGLIGGLGNLSQPSPNPSQTWEGDSRLTLVDYLGAMTNVSFTYDDAGRTKTMVDATGTTEWFYDADGQPNKMTSPQGTILYEYYANTARLDDLIESVAGPDIATHYVYDDAGQVETVSKFGETTTFGYDPAGRPNLMTYANGATATYTYDGRSRIKAIEHKNSSGTLLRKETNEYDAASRITERYEGPATGGTTTTFGYDDIGQLTSESATGYSATYTYDANGNRATKVLGGVTETYTVDDADKLTSVTYSNGNPTKTYAYHYSGRCTDITQNGVTKALAWNKENRLTGITGGGLNNSYAYNGLNTRISKSDASGSFTYKRASAHQTSPVVFDGAANFLPSISEKRAGTSTFLHSGIKNGLLQTDSSQANTATNRYDAFGNSLATTGTWKGPFAYGGKFGYQTDSAELELLGDRYYDPTIGRFLSRDAAQDGRNWYTYCGNNPISRVDPNGQFWDYLIDAAGLIWDIVEVVNDPSVENFAWLGVDAILGVIPFVPNTKLARVGIEIIGGAGKEVRGLSKAEVIAENAAKGKRAEEQALKKLREEGRNVELNKRSRSTPHGKRKVDIIERDGGGATTRYWEVKSGNARYGGKQLLKDRWLAEMEGIPTYPYRVE